MAPIRQSRPDYGSFKTVDRQRQIMAHVRQSRPNYGSYATSKAIFWLFLGSQGQILAVIIGGMDSKYPLATRCERPRVPVVN